jgi:hypothetical protein
MAETIPIRCSCGALRGALDAAALSRANRVVCYCDDCQSFAHFLGRAEAVLDAQGGTDIFQTSQGRLRFTQGVEKLACMRLRPDGLVRWYAGCCRTPLGNTLARTALPFVGLIHSCIDAGPAGAARDARLGPVRGRIFQRFAAGGASGVPPSEKPLALLMARFAALVLGARLRGEQRRSPFFDPHSGALVAQPRVLSAQELQAVEAARAAR